MTKEEFSILVKRMRIVYRKDESFIKDREAFDLWYELLSDLRFDVCRMAVDDYIKEERITPTIADIRCRYNALFEEYKAMVKHINEYFDLASGIYPCKTQEQEDRARKIFNVTVGKCPRDKRESTASSISRKIVDHVKEVEQGTDKTITPFDEYMEQITNEFTG